jgi:hypothetical protein
MPMTPAEFGKLIADETEKWAKRPTSSPTEADRHRADIPYFSLREDQRRKSR